MVLAVGDSLAKPIISIFRRSLSHDRARSRKDNDTKGDG